MIECFRGPTPTGEEMHTTYLLYQKAARVWLGRIGAPLTIGDGPAGVKIVAHPGAEPQLERAFKECGLLPIYNLCKG